MIFGTIFYRGYCAEKIFQDIDETMVVFDERYVSGYSKKSLFTRIGSANNALHIMVTEDELCIKGVIGVFTFVGQYGDLTRRVPLDSVSSIVRKGRRIELVFDDTAGVSRANIVLRIRKMDAFIQSLGVLQ